MFFLRNDNFLPGIDKILSAFSGLLTDGTLLRHCVASLYRVTVGFYLAVLIAIPLGIFLGRCRSVDRISNPLIQFLRPISPLAWAPFAILWFGIGDLACHFHHLYRQFFPSPPCGRKCSRKHPPHVFSGSGKSPAYPLEFILEPDTSGSYPQHHRCAQSHPRYGMGGGGCG